MINLYLVRHTTPAVEKGICYGQTDLGLADTFPTEAATIQASLPDWKTGEVQVYSSPLQRCYRLASHLFPDQTITRDERIQELDFGDWEMQAWSDIDQTDLHKWMNNFVHAVVPNGESYAQLEQRVKAFHRDILQNAKSNHIVVCTHAGVLHTYLAYLDGISINETLGKRKIEYGELFQRTLQVDHID